MRLTLDLAAKFSAATVLDRSGEVKYQFDSWGKTNADFVQEFADCAAEFEVNLIVIEDTPHGISSQVQTKVPNRLQGAIAARLDDIDKLDVSRLVQPATWQRSGIFYLSGKKPNPLYVDDRFDGVWKGKAAGTLNASARFGYTPPNMLEIHAAEIPPLGGDQKARNKVRQNLRKAMTDYSDAFLIGQWSLLVGDDRLIERTAHLTLEGL